MSYSLCPSCGGDGTVAPDRGATGRPWCRPCLGTGLLQQVAVPAKLPTAPLTSCACGGDPWSCRHASDAGDGETEGT